MFSFGTDNPFDPGDPIVGGANKQISVKANTPGCYKYDAGAFYPGATYGMGGGKQAGAGNIALIRFLIRSEGLATSSLEL